MQINIKLILFTVVSITTLVQTQQLVNDVELIDEHGTEGKEPAAINNRLYPFSYVLQPVLPEPTWRASAILVGDNAEGGPMGEVAFKQWSAGDAVTVTMNATGLPPGKHAVHIHAFGDLKEGCKSTGPHFRHVLIGNVEVKEDGKLELTFQSPYLSIFGSRGVVGRSVVIHEKPIEYRRFPDIYGTPIFPTLNMNQYQSEEQQTGAILACGIITVTSNLSPVVPPPPNDGGMKM